MGTHFQLALAVACLCSTVEVNGLVDPQATQETRELYDTIVYLTNRNAVAFGNQ